MKSCEECQAQIDLYLDDNLTRDEKQRFLSHISSCSECREALEFAKAVKATLANLPVLDVPDNFSQQVRAKLELETKKKKGISTYLVRYGSLAACLILAIVIAKDVDAPDFTKNNKNLQQYVILDNTQKTKTAEPTQIPGENTPAPTKEKASAVPTTTPSPKPTNNVASGANSSNENVAAENKAQEPTQQPNAPEVAPTATPNASHPTKSTEPTAAPSEPTNVPTDTAEQKPSTAQPTASPTPTSQHQGTPVDASSILSTAPESDHSDPVPSEDAETTASPSPTAPESDHSESGSSEDADIDTADLGEHMPRLFFAFSPDEDYANYQSTSDTEPESESESETEPTQRASGGGSSSSTAAEPITLIISPDNIELAETTAVQYAVNSNGTYSTNKEKFDEMLAKFNELEINYIQTGEIINNDISFILTIQ